MSFLSKHCFLDLFAQPVIPRISLTFVLPCIRVFSWYLTSPLLSFCHEFKFPLEVYPFISNSQMAIGKVNCCLILVHGLIVIFIVLKQCWRAWQLMFIFTGLGFCFLFLIVLGSLLYENKHRSIVWRLFCHLFISCLLNWIVNFCNFIWYML